MIVNCVSVLFVPLFAEYVTVNTHSAVGVPEIVLIVESNVNPDGSH